MYLPGLVQDTEQSRNTKAIYALNDRDELLFSKDLSCSKSDFFIVFIHFWFKILIQLCLGYDMNCFL